MMGNLFSPERGLIIRQRGERVSWGKCRAYSGYEVMWKRETSVDGIQRCYEDLPVKIEGEIRFLDLATRQLHLLGRSRACNTTPTNLYAEDTSGILWKLGKKGLIKDIKLRRRFLQKGLRIPEMSKLDLTHQHTRRVSIPINTLMDYLTTNEEFYKRIAEVEDMTDIREVAVQKAKDAKSWIEKEVWGPLRKYGSIIIGTIGALTAMVITWKVYKCICNRRPRQAEGNAEKVVVIPVLSRTPLMEESAM